MQLVRLLGAAIWLSALTEGSWAPHKPSAVLVVSDAALTAIALVLLFARARR
jgi:MYXO-CTERM domain-containing protein